MTSAFATEWTPIPEQIINNYENVSDTMDGKADAEPPVKKNNTSKLLKQRKERFYIAFAPAFRWFVQIIHPPLSTVEHYRL